MQRAPQRVYVVCSVSIAPYYNMDVKSDVAGRVRKPFGNWG